MDITASHLEALSEPLLQWYDHHARILPWRSNPVPYHVWVSEIMLQQTRVESVKPYFDRFLTALPTLHSLAEASEETLLKLWEGLGYYNRIRNMQQAARIVVDEYNGVLPSTFEQLLKLPGIGEYTAGAIASIAFGQVVPCVDGNVLRVFSRLLSSEMDITKNEVKKQYQQLIKDLIPGNRPGDFNQALMELGATICLPNGLPLCVSCPLAERCLGYAKGTMMTFPVKEGKKPRRIQRITVLILVSDGKLAVVKRGKGGLLAGMWELPNLQGWASEEETIHILQDWGYSEFSIQTAPKAKHVFTHIEWLMTGYFVQLPNFLPAFPKQQFRWVDSKELTVDIALPAAFKLQRTFFLDFIEK